MVSPTLNRQQHKPQAEVESLQETIQHSALQAKKGLTPDSA
jgi:chaperonin cofactor prefoldin